MNKTRFAAYVVWMGLLGALLSAVPSLALTDQRDATAVFGVT